MIKINKKKIIFKIKFLFFIYLKNKIRGRTNFNNRNALHYKSNSARRRNGIRRLFPKKSHNLEHIAKHSFMQQLAIFRKNKHSKNKQKKNDHM